MNTTFNAREIAILHMLAEYRTYEHIAKAFGLSKKTITNNVCSIMSKVGIHKQIELIAYARQHGYGRQEIPA